MKLEDVCIRVCSGGTPKSNTPAYYDGGDIPWLNTKEISFNKIRDTESHITQLGLDESSAKWIPSHSIIVAMYGATAGKSAITEIPLTTNQACCNLVIDETKADYRYVFYWLMENYSYIASLANGGAQQNLSAKAIKELEIELPPIANQHGIADFLDSLDCKIELNNQINGYLVA